MSPKADHEFAADVCLCRTAPEIFAVLNLAALNGYDRAEVLRMAHSIDPSEELIRVVAIDMGLSLPDPYAAPSPGPMTQDEAICALLDFIARASDDLAHTIATTDHGPYTLGALAAIAKGGPDTGPEDISPRSANP